MPKIVSVIIPVYNAAPYLIECLESVKNQTYKHLEIIVINDGSTDNSEELIKQFAQNDNRFKYFSQENHGLGYTRNKGVSLSTGNYIFFLDADDLIPKNAIKILVSAVSNKEIDYAVGKVLRFNSERKYVPIRHRDFNLYNKNEIVSIYEWPELLQDSIACNKLWKKEFVLENQLTFEVGKYYEDLRFTLKGAVLAKKIAVVPNTVYLWRKREEGELSITQQQMKLQNTLDRINALLANRDWLVQQGISKRIIEEHDLKSLLDVLRLHVPNYALVDQSEREIWEDHIISFLAQMSKDVFERLPAKEKRLFDLIKNKNFADLMLFSKMYLNIETEQIVEQKDSQFYLNGTKKYNVTADLKPTVIAKNIERSKDEWHISGELLVPKASKPIGGRVVVKGRESKVAIKLEIKTNLSKDSNPLYPYELQQFSFVLRPSDLFQNNKDNIFDFYFCLDGENVEDRSSRIRLHSSAEGHSEIKRSGKSIFIYRTNYGNLSCKVEKRKIKNSLKRIFLNILKK